MSIKIALAGNPNSGKTTLFNALTGSNAGGNPFEASEEIQKLTGIPMPEQVRKLRELPVRHTAECDRDKMGQAVLDVMA